MSGAHAQPDANDNATWLFIKPSPYFHNSEPWWSALFSILLLHLARGEDNFKIPLKKCVGSPEESFNSLGEYFDCSDVKFEEVLVDAKLNPKTFPDLPSEFRDIRPDIMIHRPKLKRIALIENKTVGADLGEQLDRYHEVKAHLSKEGWSAKFFLLISSGYEIRRVESSRKDRNKAYFVGGCASYHGFNRVFSVDYWGVAETVLREVGVIAEAKFDAAGLYGRILWRGFPHGVVKFTGEGRKRGENNWHPT